MQERFGKKPEWQRVSMGDGHVVLVKEVDPEILALMPESGRNFLEFLPFEGVERFVNMIKKHLGRKPKDLFP